MAFDAALLRCTVSELNQRLARARVEKVLQPEKDEIVLLLRTEKESLRLALSASSGNPRIHLTSAQKENPIKAPMFCMLLRKHLSGARLKEIRQIGFERAYEIVFETRDEMGFSCERILIGEIMGKYSNIILCDGEKRILSPLRTVDFTTSSKRQVLPGMLYENPPMQDKTDPFLLTDGEFSAFFDAALPSLPAEKFLMQHILGISPAVAREIVFSLTGSTTSPLGEVGKDALLAGLRKICSSVENGGTPSLVRDPEKNNVEYSFLPLQQYGKTYSVVTFPSFSELIDGFFTERDTTERIRQRSADLHRVVTGNISRLTKKLALIENELGECAKKEEYKKSGDLLTAYLYRLKRGDAKALLPDFETGEETAIPLDVRLSPAQNAQKYYKRYNKAKKAETELGIQKEKSETELLYLSGVLDALDRARDIRSLGEMRVELEKTGYLRPHVKTASRKEPPTEPLRYRSPNGFTVLCGKNNTQNDLLTFKTAAKSDWWFHVKNAPGSHTLLLCDGKTPSDEDLTFAAEMAAKNSSLSESDLVEVDYTLVKNIKKPPASLPGFVIYHTNSTAVIRRK